MNFSDLLNTSRISIVEELPEKESKLDIIRRLSALAAKADVISEEEICEGLWAREQLQTTAIGHGIAIPHASFTGLEKRRAAILLVRSGVPFDSLDNAPVKLFVAVLGPKGATAEHLRVLARLSRTLGQIRVRGEIFRATDAEMILSILRSAEERS